MKEIEDKHIQEKKETQRQFEDYKNRVKDKESQVEKEYGQKVNDYKLDVMDAKKKFEQRIDDLRKQMDDYKKNNDVIDEMKKAH